MVMRTSAGSVPPELLHEVGQHLDVFRADGLGGGGHHERGRFPVASWASASQKRDWVVQAKTTLASEMATVASAKIRDRWVEPRQSGSTLVAAPGTRAVRPAHGHHQSASSADIQPLNLIGPSTSGWSSGLVSSPRIPWSSSTSASGTRGWAARA